jgi:hypothetical protein
LFGEPFGRPPRFFRGFAGLWELFTPPVADASVLSIVFDSCNQQGTMTRERLIRLAYISGYSALGIGYGLCAILFTLERYDLTPMGSVLNWLDRAALWPSIGLILFSWGAIGAAYTAGLIRDIRDRWGRSSSVE